MDYSNFKEVKITHIINPNRFYCCDLSKPTITEVLRDLEKSYPVRTEYNGPLIKSDVSLHQILWKFVNKNSLFSSCATNSQKQGKSGFEQQLMIFVPDMIVSELQSYGPTIMESLFQRSFVKTWFASLMTTFLIRILSFMLGWR